MAVTYYYGDPRQFQGCCASTFRDDRSLLDYWFYPNRDYIEEVRKENARVEEANKKGGDKGGGKGKGDKGGGKGDGDKKEDDKKEGDKKQGDKKKNEPDNKPKIIELKVRLCSDAVARKVRKKLEKLEGVEKGGIYDTYENKVTVKATTKPEVVLKQVQKVRKDAQMWPQPKKEPEKKKDDKKD